MKILDANKLRELFYWGKNDKPIISSEIDSKIIEIIDACSVDINLDKIIQSPTDIYEQGYQDGYQDGYDDKKER